MSTMSNPTATQDPPSPFSLALLKMDVQSQELGRVAEELTQKLSGLLDQGRPPSPVATSVDEPHSKVVDDIHKVYHRNQNTIAILSDILSRLDL